MANLLVEIGNTALKAAWSERMTLGKTYRYQGEKYIEFIQSLIQREKPVVMVVSSVYPISQADETLLKQECSFLLILDGRHREWLVGHGLPSYLSYDRAAAILAARYLFKVVKIRNLGTTTGFEKIIIKNGMLIMFFVNNPISGYYQSKQFEKVLGRVNDNPTLFKFNQDGGKLRTVSRGVDSLGKALEILKKLQ